ncbi:hypothetical protein JG688_00008558 [Phytophthora aleatoria]|uniref:Uncharacterized protein n=1 Tax=Phytophthora aleatoria TaxID=2496075 RepID=A0A8J5IQY9_9STRA|nr:hypothetical protein JG688_00008558 [Phytophthora aleatoria]
MLLGLKTRIDIAIAGLLQHQMTINTVFFTIGQQRSISRVHKTQVSEVFAVMKTEWERFVNLTEGASGSECFVLEIHGMNITNVCNDPVLQKSSPTVTSYHPIA